MNLANDWKEVLASEFEKPYFNNLMQFVNQEYETNTCYPPKQYIFSAFDHCSFNNLKVVIIGQDPYHGFGQANGLCFSVYDGVKMPPSLVNIFKELENDLSIPIAISGNLERWAKQGVLLLNATLTVKEGEAGSHQKKGWEQFTDAVIKIISDQKEQVVFLLWGAFAHKKGAVVDKTKHLILQSGHPSPLSANRGYWFNQHHFSKTNNYLSAHLLGTIEW